MARGFRMQHQREPYTFNWHRESGTAAVEVAYDGHLVTVNTMSRLQDLKREKKGRELQLLANALLICGYVPSHVTSAESPDFSVRFRDGEEVSVEVTEALRPQTAGRHSDFSKLQGVVAQALMGVNAPYRSLGYSVNIYFDAPPRLRVMKKCAEEVLAFLHAEDVLSMGIPAMPVWMPERIPQGYPTLYEHGARALPYRNASPPYQVHLQVGFPFMLSDMSVKGAEKTIFARLNDKRGKALQWPHRPIWLLIAITELNWQNTEVFRRVQRHLKSIFPFSNVLISGSGNVCEIRQKRLFDKF